MNLLILGRGKTGSLVAEYARERGHEVQTLGSSENADGSALSAAGLAKVDVVIDFTNPKGVVKNIEACVRAHKNMVVGTTGWYDHLPRLRERVQQSGIGLVYGSNFSVGVNLFFEIARAAAPALQNGYTARIIERHHEHKKDAPSGTAITLRNALLPQGATNPEKAIEITSIREGETVGQHVILLDSPNDTMMLVHDAKSRRGFAEGAVRAAEWIAGKSGFFDFQQVLQG